MRNIMYAIDSGGRIWSRVGSEVAVPVLDYKGMTPENNFETKYNLEKAGIYCIIGVPMFWTKKIPLDIKNIHRTFWGMPKLVETDAKKNNP